MSVSLDRALAKMRDDVGDQQHVNPAFLRAEATSYCSYHMVWQKEGE
jgi:hypothetical protein